MKATFAVRPNNKTFSKRCTKALRDCLGGSVIINTYPVPDECDLLINWGFNASVALLSAIDKKIPFVILDRGYFEPSRVDRVSISFNGHHGLSMPVDGVLDLPPRWHPPIQGWRLDGDTVQIIGQTAGDAALRNIELDAWMNRAAVSAVDAFGKRVIKRRHPKMIAPHERRQEALHETFDDTYVSVSLTSTSAVQTVLAGIPSVIQHPASPAFEMGSTNMVIATPPGRDAWAHELAHREYDLCNTKDAAECAEYIIRAFPQATKRAAAGTIDTLGIL